MQANLKMFKNKTPGISRKVPSSCISASSEMLDQVLPQTQCQLCGYKGCMPYAQAIVTGKETINRCLPGGVETLFALAELTGQDATPYVADMKQKAIPIQLAVIQEETCIGCTKCIHACPVDAIIGAAKQMHSILSDICTGCGLCLPPCPVDCIDLITLNKHFSKEEKHAKANRARLHYQERNMLLNQKQKIMGSHSKAAKISADEIKQAIDRVLHKRAHGIKRGQGYKITL